MKKGPTYRVSEVARIAGVSVRTLHYYDEIGLIAPLDRTGAGYRLYDNNALLRLQQVLIGRELGMPLEKIKRSLDDPTFDRRAALLKQRREIELRAERCAAMLCAIDAALCTLTKEEAGEHIMEESSKERIMAMFDGFDPSRYEEEVKERWGHTHAYEESARRVSSYTKADWERFMAESGEIMTDAAALFRSGARPDADAAAAVAERHRHSINRWFYPCTPELHARLADGYEADGRFAESIDQYAPGLTTWWSAAIRANSRR